MTTPTKCLGRNTFGLYYKETIRIFVEDVIHGAQTKKEQAEAKTYSLGDQATPAASPWNPEALFWLITPKTKDVKFQLSELVLAVCEESIPV